ncbi:Hpt domain-containing protein [Candidatus Fermentibacteria bacterium]|nr:Hpt domain-containing protein [Candidatus Fermentibacteria bacterium]
MDPDLMELIPGYLENRQKDIDRLKEMLKKRQYREIERCGHSMKGSGAGYGFQGITTIGAFLERAGKSQSVSRIEEGIDRLEDYLENLEIVQD